MFFTQVFTMAVVGLLTVSLGLLGVSVLFNGFALSVLWGWFISSVFGLPVLTVGQAIGVSMVVSFLTWQYKSDEGKKEWVEVLAEGIALAVVKPLVALAFGWVVYAVAF
jgi:hypothetical protein